MSGPLPTDMELPMFMLFSVLSSLGLESNAQLETHVLKLVLEQLDWWIPIF